jgi:hypothetical protein
MIRPGGLQARDFLMDDGQERIRAGGPVPVAWRN